MRPSSVLIAAGVALLAGAGLRAQGQQSSRIYTAEIDGIIHPVAAEYVAEVIAKADADKAALVVFTLRTPGGLVDSPGISTTRSFTPRRRSLCLSDRPGIARRPPDS